MVERAATAARSPLTRRHDSTRACRCRLPGGCPSKRRSRASTRIRQALADPATLIGSGAGATGGTEAPRGASGSGLRSGARRRPAARQKRRSAALTASRHRERRALRQCRATRPRRGLAGPQTGAGGGGERVLAAAESQVGQSEQPPGSNESPAIAEYRTATAGAEPGAPWCAYFASWAARQAGEPIGPSGQGLGSVSEIWSWAQSTGRAVSNGPGVVPAPGRSDRLRRRARRDRARSAARRAHRDDRGQLRQPRRRPTCARPAKPPATSA